MKTLRRAMPVILLILVFAGAPSALFCGEDIRTGRVEAAKVRQRLVEAAKKERQDALNEKRAQEEAIFADRERLKGAVSEKKAESGRLAAEIERLAGERAALLARSAELATELPAAEAEVRELTGFIRQSAKDLDALLLQSPQGGFGRNRDASVLTEIAGNRRFPSMADCEAMLDLLAGEIESSGQVRRDTVPVVTRQGAEADSTVFLAGNFSAFGRVNGETDFLTYSPASGRFFQLSRPSPSGMRDKLAAYMEGRAEEVPVDLSRGAALRQLVHRLDWKEQVQSGGPVVWPILLIALAAVILSAERLVFLLRVRTNAERLMSEVADLAAKKDWDACTRALKERGDRPVVRVLLSGLAARDLSREDMENVLSEAILREIPKLERFLPTLGMLAAISPLLGLLGTVTGMINTFHVITFAGTGDPQVMSGGISEALVTTMLGLAVAIPVTLAHTLLSRMSERIVGQMEEKSMALVNAVAATGERK